MKRGSRAVAIALMIAAASFVIHADITPVSQSGEIELQLANALYRDGRYQDSLDAYRRALLVVPPDDQRAARAGVVRSALRVAEFDLARVEADALVKSAPQAPEAIVLYADALWASGLFEEAENQYRAVLTVSPDLARGHHGMARALAARGKLQEAMDEAQTALRLSPRDLELHHTVGAIYERMHQYEEAAGAFSNYVNLLPNKDHSEKPTGRGRKSSSCDRSASGCRSKWIRAATTSCIPSTSGGSTTRWWFARK